MAARPISLDQGPPLPQQLQAPPQQATAAGLAGAPPADASGSAALQQAVIQKLMFVEKTLNDVGQMMPAAAPAVSGIIDQLRKGMGAVLAQGATPPPAPGTPSAGGMLMAPQAAVPGQ